MYMRQEPSSAHSDNGSVENMFFKLLLYCWVGSTVSIVLFKTFSLKDQFLNTVWFPTPHPQTEKYTIMMFLFSQMVQAFSRCILCSKDEMDLDELLAAKLVSFLMDNYQEILSVPSALKSSIEEHVIHLQRVQVGIQWKYPLMSLC